MSGSVTRKWFVAVVFSVGLSGCPSDPNAGGACIDKETDTLILQVVNTADFPVSVPTSRPRIGCCGGNELSISIVDADGAEVQRCGTSDNFLVPDYINLEKDKSIVYQISAKSLSGVYCGVDLEKSYVSAKYGRDEALIQLSPSAERIRSCKR